MLAATGTEAIVMLRPLVAVCIGFPASVTWALKLKVPAAVGVPAIAPLSGLSVRPGGRDPLAINQAYGVVPPLAVNVAEHATLTVPAARDVVVMVIGRAWTASVPLPVTPARAAEITVLPAETAVATPVALTVATVVFDELQVAWLVTFCVLPSEYVPVAVNCCVPLATIVGFAGVTARDVRVATAAGLNTTSTQ
jgi:hypothetical protein